MKVLGIILICFISFTTNATNLFYYSSFECLFDLSNLTIHKDGDFSKSKEINQSFIIKFEDIASYYGVSSSTATVVYLNDKNKEIKKSDIIVIQETDMLSFVEGRSFSELKPQYRTLTTIFDYYVEDNKFLVVRSAHEKKFGASSNFIQQFGYCSGTKIKE